MACVAVLGDNSGSATTSLATQKLSDSTASTAGGWLLNQELYSRISVLMAWKYALADFFPVCYWAHDRLQVIDSCLLFEKDEGVVFEEECSTET